MANQNPLLLAADNSPNLLSLLRANPSLASTQDEHGYSILHATASYNHLKLLRTVVNEFHIDPNITDEDGETPLFVVETVEAAQTLLEELGADPKIRNDEGLTAEEKIQTEGDYTTIAEFLRESRLQKESGDQSAQNGVNGKHAPDDALFRDDVRHPPPLPPNVTMNIGTMEEEQSVLDGAEVDPEFKARIEELAAREDFQGEEGQRQLRELISDAVRGVGGEGGGRNLRRRLE